MPYKRCAAPPSNSSSCPPQYQMAKQQDALFRQALSLHESATSTQSFQRALSLYAQASEAANQTFPIAFNTAAVCQSLADLLPHQATFYHNAAASYLQQALNLLPHNLEALTAAAAIEDARARASSSQLQTQTHREQAVQFLKRGRDAEFSDPGIRTLLAVR